MMKMLELTYREFEISMINILMALMEKVKQHAVSDGLFQQRDENYKKTTTNDQGKCKK